MQILSFGNNIAGSLAEDLTAEQTTIQVLQGEGEMFKNLLSTDYENPTVPLSFYAKLTITNNQQSAHEIIHLLSVDNDTLTVLRGQEKTTARGWELNDFIGNMPTRGSENSFVQIGHQQAAFYTCGVAGGTANALTLTLPTDFFINGSDEWELNAPLVVIPKEENTGPATLQITLGNKTVGKFPLYKGERDELDEGDILKGVPILCLLNKSEGYVSVINPSQIYDVLGTAAFRNVQTGARDRTDGRVALVDYVVGVNNAIASFNNNNRTVQDCNDLPVNSVSFVYADATNSPGLTGTILDVAGLFDGYRVQIAVNYSGPSRLKFRAFNNDNAKSWSDWVEVYSPNNVPSAATVGAVPITRTINGKQLNGNISLNSNDIFNNGQTRTTLGGANLNDVTTPGLYSQNANANATTARNYPVAAAGALMVLYTATQYQGVNGVRQLYMPYNTADIYSRKLNVDGWGQWARVYTTQFQPTAASVGAVPVTRKVNGKLLNADITITSQDIFNGSQTQRSLTSENLNSVTTPGLYRQAANVNATTARNYPVAAAGALMVLLSADAYNGTPGVRQVYLRYENSDIYTRSLAGNGWSKWARVYTTLSRPTAGEVGAVPLSGGVTLTNWLRNNSYFATFNPNGFKLVQNYTVPGTQRTATRSVFWRFDGQNVYFLISPENQPYNENWTNLRPLVINCNNGEVSTAHNFTCNAKISAGGDLYAGGNANVNQILPRNFTNLDQRYLKRGDAISGTVAGIRLGVKQDFGERGGNEHGNGTVMTSWADFGKSKYHIYVRQLQYAINGRWVSVPYTNSGNV